MPVRCWRVWHRHVGHRHAMSLATGVQIYRLAVDATRGRDGWGCRPQNDHGESSPRTARNDYGLPQATCCSNAGIRRTWRRKHRFSVRVLIAEPQGVPFARFTRSDGTARRLSFGGANGRRRGGEEIVDDLDEFRRLFEERHVAAFFEDHEFRSGNRLVDFVFDDRSDVHVEAPAHD